MCLQTVLLALLLTAFPVTQASPLLSGSGDYFSQQTQDKHHTDPAQQLKHGQVVRNLKERFQDDTDYVGRILEKLASPNSGVQSQFYQDVNGLRRLIQGDIESLRLKLSSYMDEGHPEFDEKLDNLHFCLILLAEKLMDQVSRQARELQQCLRPSLGPTAQRFAIHYAEKVAFHTDQVKEIFQLHEDRLVAEIQQRVEELHRNVVPRATAMPEQANRYIQEFSNRLTQNVRVLHLKFQESLEQLRGQLSHIFSRPQAPWQALEDLTKDAQERTEEFRRDTVLQVVHFTRTIDREVGDMKLNLHSLPSYLEEFQENSTPLGGIHVRLNSLLRAISQSLGSLD